MCGGGWPGCISEWYTRRPETYQAGSVMFRISELNCPDPPMNMDALHDDLTFGATCGYFNN